MSSAADCVFCKIVAGQIPSLKLLEDQDCLSFLDVGPLAEGHTLLIPKTHYEKLTDMPDEVVARVMAHLPRLGRAVMRVTGAEGFNLLQNNGKVSGQVVPHVHFHIIPRVAGDALGYRWPAGSYPEGRAENLARQFVEAFE